MPPSTLSIKTWNLKELWHKSQDKELDLAPDYQRREAWSAKKKMVLIDSVARRIPVNAVTLYKRTGPDGTVYEVIDGKQRLTALVEFLKDDLVALSEAVEDLSEEEEVEGRELAEAILDKKWSHLTAATRSAFLEYEVPIYIVEGTRASAVRAFRRMNADPYALRPQEIRNAVFKDSEFLHATRRLADELEQLRTGSDHFLVEWGVINPTQWNRMQDLQFLSEILCLQLDGPQEARRTLDDFYEDFQAPKGKDAKKLKGAEENGFKGIKALTTILGNSLKEHGFDGENGAYALVGALAMRGLPTAPQLADKDAIADLRSTLRLFGNEVLLCQQAIKENDQKEIDRFTEEVKEYASTLLGGQINSGKRRRARIDALVAIINDRLNPIDPKKVSDLQRRLVWARSQQKLCGRCGKEVDYKDYDCGHIDAKAFGGRPVVHNLRVEHSACNRGAKD